MKRIPEGLFIAIAMLFVGGCTAEQWDRVLKSPSPSPSEESTQEPPPDYIEQPPQIPTPPPPPPPPSTAKQQEIACHNLVQDKIAWDYKGSRRWNPTNVQRLCRGTSNGSQPAACFNRVMHGRINWGGGTQWQWGNAINLCEGTNNSAQTIACFQNRIKAKQSWQSAISACSK